MDRRWIQNQLGKLPGWMALLGPRVQTLQRDCRWPSYRSAVQFLGEVSEMAEERQLFPHLQLRPSGPRGVPTQVRVRIISPDLKPEHFELAQVVAAAYAAKTHPDSAPALTVLK